MKKKLLTAMLAAVVLLPALADTFHDRTDPNATGGIRGKVTGGKLEDIIAAEQTSFKFYQGSCNANTGEFTFRNLPPGRYDLLVKLQTDVIEGFRLDIWGETEELSTEDRQAITKLINVTDDFFPHKKIVRAGGTKERHKLIVEQIRTETHYDPDGALNPNMIRRIDYVIVRKTREVWQIEKLRHMYRELKPRGGVGSVVAFHNNSRLGGIRVADETVELDEIQLERKK